MSGTLLHSAIAAGAGLAIGISATLALSKPKKESPAAPPPSAAGPGSSGVPPTAFPRPNGIPTVYNGGLTTLGSPLIQPSSIGPISDLLVRTAYVTAYDRRNRIPAWTAEHLTAANLRRPSTDGSSSGAGGDRQNSVFKEDASIPDMFRAHLLDYFKSGYDRGHMVPAADAKQSQQAMDETFLLTNIAPQVGDGFNRHYWAYVEAFVRNLTTSFEDVYVFTVPLFLPKRDGRDGKFRVTYEMIAPQGQPPSIAVPTHFAKVVLASKPGSGGGSRLFGSSQQAPPPPSASSANADASSLVPAQVLMQKEWSLGAFVLPNEVIPDETKLTDFVVPVEAVERSSGLSLFAPNVKAVSKPLCQTTKCEVIVRRFDDAQKGANRTRSSSAPPPATGALPSPPPPPPQQYGQSGQHQQYSKKPGPGWL